MLKLRHPQAIWCRATLRHPAAKAGPLRLPGRSRCAPGAIDTGLASSELPSVRRIRREMHVGRPRAQAIRDYLSVLTRRYNVSTISRSWPSYSSAVTWLYSRQTERCLLVGLSSGGSTYNMQTSTGRC